MAYSITSSGVDFTRGRGAAKVTLSMSFKELERWARANKIDTDRLMKRSFGRACSGLKKKFFEVMQNGGGVNGVPKFRDFEAFTNDLRRINGKTAPMGGTLAKKSSIVAFKQNGYQVIGWPDALSKYATSFQDGEGGSDAEKMFTDPSVRASLHRRGIRDIPRGYVHNRREVIPGPFGAYVEKNLNEWARGAFYKELARQMQKARAA